MKRSVIQAELGCCGPSQEYTPHWAVSFWTRWKCMRMLPGATGAAAALGAWASRRVPEAGALLDAVAGAAAGQSPGKQRRNANGCGKAQP
jgi:hypothetical protein